MIKSENSAVLLITLLILFFGCQPDEEHDPVFEPVIERTFLDRESELKTLFTDFEGLSLNGRADQALTDFGTLDLTQITKRISSESQQKPNYTIRLIPPEGVHFSREYLVLIGELHGYRGYILQYQANEENAVLLYDQDKFTGNIRLLDFERKVMSDNLFEDGKDTGSATNGRQEDDYVNCTCWYTGGQALEGDDDLQGETEVLDITCSCQQADSFEDQNSGGGGGISGPPGVFIGNPSFGGGGFGGSSGSGSDGGDGGELEPAGPELPSDDVAVIIPSCDENSVPHPNGGCIPKSLKWVEDHVTLTEAFEENECLKQIFDQLIINSDDLYGTLKNFTGNEPIADITFDLVDEESDEQFQNLFEEYGKYPHAFTSSQTRQGNLVYSTIKIGKNYLQNSTYIEVARTIIHESIHAEIKSIVYGTHRDPELLKEEFPVAFEVFITGNYPFNSSRANHNLMAQDYIPKLVLALKDYDGTQFDSPIDDSYYTGLAWVGLHDTDVWESMEPWQQDLHKIHGIQLINKYESANKECN